jgi:hypothetical protein
MAIDPTAVETPVEEQTEETAEVAAANHDFKSADGAEIQVRSSAAGVTVYQGAAGTQGRGAALLTPDEADELAASLTSHAADVRKAAKAAPAPSTS